MNNSASYAVSQAFHGASDYSWLEPWGVIVAVLLLLILWVRLLLKGSPKGKKSKK